MFVIKLHEHHTGDETGYSSGIITQSIEDHSLKESSEIHASLFRASVETISVSESRASPALAISWELSSFRAVLSAACLNIDNLSLCEFISTLFIFYVRRFNQNQINHPEGSIIINHSYALDLCLCCLRHIDIVHHTNRMSVLYLGCWCLEYLLTYIRKRDCF